jgi:hypothetical protein
MRCTFFPVELSTLFSVVFPGLTVSVEIRRFLAGDGGAFVEGGFCEPEMNE